jgi:hypothetical protein
VIDQLIQLNLSQIQINMIIVRIIRVYRGLYLARDINFACLTDLLKNPL